MGAGSSLQLQVAGLGAQVPVRGYRFGRAGSSLQITGLNARVPVTSYRFGRVGSSSQEVAGLGAGSSLQLQFAGLGAQVYS